LSTSNDVGGGEPLASIMGTLFNDLNANGLQESNEPGWSHRTVVLESAGGQAVQTAVTDDQGRYLFSDLMPGNYRVRVRLEEHEQQTTPSDWWIPLHPGQRAVAPKIGGVDRAVAKGPEEQAPDEERDEIWKLLGQGVVLLAGLKPPKMAPRRRANRSRPQSCHIPSGCNASAIGSGPG
jgi:hypothetical protein